jgi:PEP-CTERM motif-containing protein
VGQIDLKVGRKKGEGVWRSDLLDGKLKYLDDFGPDGLVIKHQGVFDKEGAITIAGDRTQGGTTSTFMGKLVTIDFLMKEIEHGEDVEMDLTFNGTFGGGHEIMITGGDFILGRPWVTFVHDYTQGDNTKGTGLLDGGYGFAWLDDPGGGNFLQFKGYVIGADGLAAGVRNVITESPVPEPGTLMLVTFGLIRLAFGRKHHRRLRLVG